MKKKRSILKKNTKRKMNKRNKRTKRRRTYSLRRGERNRSNKKLYGGMEGTGATGSDVATGSAEGAVTDLLTEFSEMINAIPFLKVILPTITLDDIRENYSRISDKIDKADIISENAHILDKSIASDELFSFWHGYGCVLSDETIYKLFKALYFHSIFEGYMEKTKGTGFDLDIASCKTESRDRIYESILAEFPGIRELGILYLKLKHFFQDLKMNRDAHSLAAVFNLTADFLKILVNLAITSVYYQGRVTNKGNILGPTGVKNLPVLHRTIGEKIIPALKTYIESAPFDQVKRRDFDSFNGILIHTRDREPTWETEGKYSITLDSLKKAVSKEDPISGLVSTGEAYGPYGYPALEPAAAAAVAPAPVAPVAPARAPAAAARALEPAPAAVAEVVRRVDHPKEDILVEMGFNRDKARSALNKNDGDMDRAINSLFSAAEPVAFDFMAPVGPREPEPAAAALEPEPAVQQGLTEDQKAAYDNLLQFGYTPDATLKALESVNWDLDRASDVILQ
jgi:hypothetical protein